MIVLVLLLANSHVGAPPAATAEAPADNAFLLVAHRGVVTESLTENSLGALEETIRRGYTHVEVDLRCTSDGHAVCLHDRNLMRTVGVDRNVEEITLAELRKLIPQDVAPSFRTYCERGHERIGLMPDLKGCPASLTNRFVESVKGSLVEFGLADSALFIGHPLLTRHFSGLGKQSWPIPLARTQEMEPNKKPGRGHFVFGHAVNFNADEVRGFQAMGLQVIVSINTGHYKTDDAVRQGNDDVKKMLELGVDGLQIDAVYEGAFPKGLFKNREASD